MGDMFGNQKQHGSNASVGNSADMGMAILKALVPALPYIGWAGVVFLPFFFASGKDFTSVAIWQYVVSAVVGIGIAIGTRFIPFPPKLKWLSKVLLWLPIVVVAIVAAIALFL